MRSVGISCTNTFMTGGASRVRLKLKDPLIWDSPDSCGFVFDWNRRLSVVVSWITKRYQICNGNLGLDLHRPIIHCS